jgi:cytidylate kinase
LATITISRQFGSGGRKIAARVAELLEYQFFDKRFIVQVAAQSGISESEFVDFTEDQHKVKTFLDRLRERFGNSPPQVTESRSQSQGWIGVDMPRVQQLDEAAAVSVVNTAIRAAYERGNMVIVGRGGQVLLKDKPDVLHVRIEAPDETRIARLREFEGLPPLEARRAMAEKDRAAAEYMERYFQTRLDDPMLYHLVINTGKCDIEMAAGIIAQSVKQLETQKVAV